MSYYCKIKHNIMTDKTLIKRMYKDLKKQGFSGGRVIKKLSGSFALSVHTIRKIVYKKRK